MGIQENLFNNLLVVGILGSLVIIIYCKVRNQSIMDLWREIRAGFAEPVEDYYE
jgi:hypothetical protein